MVWLRRALLVLLLVAISGCGGGREQKFEVIPPNTPLTVEQWKTLPIPEKYDLDTFERLKLNDPKLKDDKAWDEFMRTVIVPERKIDIPQTPQS